MSIRGGRRGVKRIRLKKLARDLLLKTGAGCLNDLGPDGIRAAAASMGDEAKMADAETLIEMILKDG